MNSRRSVFHADGVALVLVLWVVAALTVLVTGLIAAQRSELRLVASERTRVQAYAIGSAVMAQVLHTQALGLAAAARQVRLIVRYADADVEVEVMPLTGLIDLNLAPGPLLTALWRDLGRRDDAERLTGQVMVRRQSPPGAASAVPGATYIRLARPEQLLALSGFDADLVARIRPFVTTGSGGSGRVNPLAAPLEVLKLLANGDEALARRINDERDAGTVMIDTTRLEGNYIDAGSGSMRLRLTARVPSADGTRIEVLKDVELGRGSQPGGVPWRVLDSAVIRSFSLGGDEQR